MLEVSRLSLHVESCCKVCMSSQGGGPPRVADGRISHSLTAGEPRVIALGLTTLTHAFFQLLNLGYYVSFEH